MRPTRKTGLRLGTAVADYLTFSRVELRGIFALLAILTVLIAGNVIIPSSTKQVPADMVAFQKEVSVFELAWKEAVAEEQKERRRGTSGYRQGFGRLTDTLPSYPPKSPVAFVVELNGADTFDLQRLRGIGPAFARRIIGYREKLGGFVSENQVLEVFGMDSVRLNAILHNISVNPDSVRRIDLNKVTFKELLKHPYFPFELTKAIMIYRQKKKRFQSVDELKTIPGVNDSVFQRMEKYLTVIPE
jgi:DNA uptake protein ComE-like DNA-binding protein